MLLYYCFVFLLFVGRRVRFWAGRFVRVCMAALFVGVACVIFLLRHLPTLAFLLHFLPLCGVAFGRSLWMSLLRDLSESMARWKSVRDVCCGDVSLNCAYSGILSCAILFVCLYVCRDMETCDVFG